MSLSTHLNYHIHSWLEKIEDNVEAHKAILATTTSDEDIAFLAHQYHLMMLIHKALEQKVIFTGAKPIAPTDEPTQE